jgi:hypothetical protein
MGIQQAQIIARDAQLADEQVGQKRSVYAPANDGPLELRSHQSYPPH